jgi:hypothetical protein
MKSISRRATVVFALTVSCLAFNAQAQADGVILHQYRLNQWTGLTDDFGGPNLTSHGGTYGTGPCATTNTCQGYTFGAGQGLSVAGALGASNEYANNYSIVIDYFLDQTSSWQKAVDFQGLCTTDATCNSGIYAGGTSPTNGRLRAYRDNGTSSNMTPAGSQLPGVASQVTLTRTAGGTFTVNDDGLEALLTDNGSDFVFSGPDAVISFFMDELFTPNPGGTSIDPATGFVDTIRIFGGALSAEQMAQLQEVQDTAMIVFDEELPPVPEPGTLLLVASGLALTVYRARRRRAMSSNG